MELELTANAEAVASLGRLKPLAGNRIDRAKTQSVKIVWHDSPEHALLAAGLALAEQRGIWRLERVVPGAETWLPGQPVPLVAEAPEPDSLPSPLAPLAAFEGRRTVSVHQFGDSPVTMTVEKGVLRTVAAERSAARIRISGDAAPVRAAAMVIADAIGASVPLVSLPAEAIGLATGRGSPPRHQGAPVLPEALNTPADALAHIIGHLTDVILAHALAAVGQDEAATDAVHQMRVAVRRARSALSIFRSAVPPGALDEINASLRQLGHQLGPARDWDVFVEETLPTIQLSVAEDARLQRLVTAAARRRREHRAALTAYLKSAAFRTLGIELAWFLASGTLQAVEPDTIEAAVPLAAFSAEVLQSRWKKLIGSGKRMDELDIPALHGVRLRAKRARYAAEMFATLHAGKAPHRFIRRLSELQQRLGVLNDGAVATHLLEELGGAGGRHAYAAGLIVGFMAARVGDIRPRVVGAFEKFRRQPTYWG